jgi:hypothetical protein
MILLWLVTSAALAAAFVALRQARRTARRLAQLSEMYWELKYLHGELRAQLQGQAGDAGPLTTPPPSVRPSSDGFVPLASLKR